MKTHTCKKCDYRWISRVVNPKSCPRCKRYDWQGEIKTTKKPRPSIQLANGFKADK